MNSPRATSDSDNARLDDLYRRLGEASRTFVGYPCNQRFDYSHLHRFLKFAANNVGDQREEAVELVKDEIVSSMSGA